MENKIHDLEKLAKTKMPYGKYKGYFLIDLPEPYVVWYHNKVFLKYKRAILYQTSFEKTRNYILTNQNYQHLPSVPDPVIPF